MSILHLTEVFYLLRMMKGDLFHWYFYINAICNVLAVHFGEIMWHMYFQMLVGSAATG